MAKTGCGKRKKTMNTLSIIAASALVLVVLATGINYYAASAHAQRWLSLREWWRVKDLVWPWI